MKKLILPLLTMAFFVSAAQVRTVKIAPNKDTVLVTSTTTVTTTSNTVITTIVLPTTPTNPPPGGSSGEIALSFTPETAYIQPAFAGAEDWNGQNYSPIPSPNPQARKDLYFRLLWTQLEGPTQGSYNWTVFDQWINRAITNKQRFSFGVFALCPGGCDPFNGPVNYGGAPSGYPLYLHNLMQAESVKDRIMSGTWVPNWNSQNFLGRLNALNMAIRDHINTGSFNGVPYKNVIGYIDIRIMGSWGEWHHAGIVDNMNQYPAGMRPVVSTYKWIIDSHISAFPSYQLVMLLAALDAERLNHTLTPIEVTNYALTVRNTWGLLGIRSDQRGSLQWNDQGNYVRQYMENNNKSWQGGPLFSTLTMSRWQTAPLVGEPENNQDNPNLQTLVAQTQFYHQNSVGNGNYTRSSGADANMRNAAMIMGYKLAPLSGKLAWNTSGVTITMNWQNTGLTPNYENWNVVFEIVNSSGAVIRTASSAFKPRLFLPAQSATTFIDNVTALPAGTYSAKMTVRDPTGYREPLALQIKGRNSDGSYTLGSFTVSPVP